MVEKRQLRKRDRVSRLFERDGRATSLAEGFPLLPVKHILQLLHTAVHNVYFVKYIFPRNRTSSDISKNLKNTILLNIYLSQLVRVRGKYTFLSFSDFQTLDP